MPGELFIVATPIGNLQDITLRAIEILKQVDLIAAEDTRHSRKLLMHYGIETALTSFHEHSELEKGELLIAKMLAGASIALITDAGTPLVSDPGYRLVNAAHLAAIKVTPIPGACAAITALSVAGLPSDRFFFEGFLPSKEHAREERLQELVNHSHTLIFYESPHRVVNSLLTMQKIFGHERRVAVARELTKTFETIYVASLAEIVIWLQTNESQQKGEFVLLVAPDKPEKQHSGLAEGLRVYQLLKTELSTRQAVKLAATITGCSKNQLYEEVCQGL